MHTIYDIALSMESLSGMERCRLFRHFGNAEAVYRQPLLNVQRILGKRRTFHPEFLEEARKIDAFIHKSGIQTLRIDDVEFPRILEQLDNPPFLLYLRGNKKLLSYRMAAVVGTRHPSEMGINVTRGMVETLKKFPCAVISGLAKGVDAVAHQAALAASLPTVGVLGCGIDVVYPKESRELAFRMVESGNLLLSEYPPGSKPYRWHFPERNRLIAALSSVVLLSEAPSAHSGTIITARFAMEFGRDLGVFFPSERKKEQFAGNIILLEEAGFPLRSRNDLQMLLDGVWEKR